ncbi:MAG: phosphatidate cytidylyltransferase [Deferribacteraceae bacterium]|jgi:phosphatidate cytidylyltransferase|nr:phosphatidate cytidylyltransferase [Deferribacteraceae bacterium]
MALSKEHIKRVISALILIPIVLVLTLWSYTPPFAAALYFITLLASYEMINLAKKAGEEVFALVAWFGAAVIPLIFHFDEFWAAIFVSVLVIIVFLSFFLKLLQANPAETVFRTVSVNIFIASLTPLFLSFIWLIRNLDGGGWWILLLFVSVWGSDICAYYIGMNFGKHRIIPKISPKKTLEGFIAGFIGGILAGGLFYLFIIPTKYTSITNLQLALLLVDVIAAGILGDLFESLLKRNAGLKDSGNIIPGHGGVLDRADAIIFAAPVMYIYLKIFFHIN